MPKDSVVGNIGQPLASVSVFILGLPRRDNSKTEFEILPVGQVGELAVGGHQLSKGYINRPEQTEAAFINLKEYGTLYRTGDKARRLPGGKLECLGRITNTQVKLRGQRIELGEIEQTAYRVDGVELACVIVVEGSLVIFCSSSKNVTQADIMLAFDKWLPRFMRPNSIILLMDVPRLPSGKVDKKALEQYYRNRIVNSGTTFANDLAGTLAQIVGSELGTYISPDANLPSQGLDSLRAIGLASKLRGSGYGVSASQLLELESITEIAGVVEGNVSPDVALDNSKATEERAKLKKIASSELKGQWDNVQDVDICTPIQNSMLSESMTELYANYNWFEVDLGGQYDLDQIIQAMELISARNDILRSGFHFIDIYATFARIIWKALPHTQFSSVPRFDYQHHTTDRFSLLTPLTCQLSADGLKVLFHAHHAIFDGWSLDQLLLDLRHVLSGVHAINRPPYRLVSEYYTRYLASGSCVADERYWKSYLLQARPSRFPILCSKKLPATTQHYSISSRVSRDLLQETAIRLGVSKPSLAVAAYAYLLARYTESPDAFFGMVSSGRTLPIPGIEHIIGPCLTTFPVIADLAKTRTVRDLIVQCYRANRNALEHESFPLARMKALTGSSTQDLFVDTLFVWQESLATQSVSENSIRIRDSQDRLRFNLVLEVEPKDENIELKMAFRSNVLPPEHARVFCEQFDLVFEYFASSLNKDIAEVDEVFNGHQSLLSSISISPTWRDNMSSSLVSNFEQLAAQQPNRPALQYIKDFDPSTLSVVSDTLSYAQLNQKADILATFLLSKGCKANDIIAVWLEKSVETYVSKLAIIKSGAAYLPLDPSLPLARAEHILADSGTRLLLTATTFHKTKDLSGSVEIVCVDESPVASSGFVRPRTCNQSSDLAYVIFTSGTTGKPKGVKVTRRNIMSNIDVLFDIYPKNASGRLLQSCSPAFDVAVFEIFFTWHSGMCLVSATNDVLFRDIDAFIHSTEITHLSLTPTVANLLDRSRIPNVQFLVTAGEGLSQAHRVLGTWTDGKSLYQGYGPAETTNILTVNQRMDADNFANNVGPPLPNSSAFVISTDSGFKILPLGMVGEFCFGGDQVCAGYLNSPSLTAEKFINHNEHGWLYRSGDMGRLLSDGTLQSIGRRDDQVKIRGQRVELGEIDNTLRQQRFVTHSKTLFFRPSTEEQERLVCFWSGPREEKVATKDILNILSRHLPAYMTPEDAVYLEHLPRTVQGKIDQRALVKQYSVESSTHRSTRQQHGRDLSRREYFIAKTVAEICGCSLEAIGPETSLVSLGLDSIKAIALSRKLRALGIGRYDVSSILKQNSAQGLSEYSFGSSPEERSTLVPSEYIEPSIKERIAFEFENDGMAITKILPCTPLQETMLSESSLDETVGYHNEITMNIYAELSGIRSAWNLMIERHEILRTIFVPTDDGDFPFVQVVLQHHDLPLELPVESGQQSIYHRNVGHSRTPLWKLEFQKLQDRNASRLIISMHHALYDAEAFSVLVKEIEVFLKQGQLRAAPELDDYLVHVIAARLPDSLKFWDILLDKYEPVHLFQDIRSFQSRRVITVQRISGQSWSKLRQICADTSVNYTNLLQAAWTRVLMYFTSSTDVCFGNVFGGREFANVDSLVAPCFNTLPVRLKVPKFATNLDLVRDLRNQVISILPYQASSLRLIQKRQGLNGKRLFDTLLLVQQPQSPLDNSIWSVHTETGSMPFPLIVEALPDEFEDILKISVHSNEGIITQEFLDHLVSAYDAILGNTCSYLNSQCSDMSFFDKDNSMIKEYRLSNKGTVRPQGSAPSTLSRNLDQESKVKLSKVQNSVAKLASKPLGEVFDPNLTIFQLGLDSINAFQLSSSLARLGLDIGAADIMECASIKNIAAQARPSEMKDEAVSQSFDFDNFDRQYRDSICKRLNLSGDEVQSIRPCTNAQSGMLAQFLNSEALTYLNKIEYDTSLPSRTTLRAWQRMCATHEILRSGFVQVEDSTFRFAMVTYTTDAFDVPIVENFDGSIPMDVYRSLHRCAWRININEGLIRLFIHHALYDARSLRILLADAQNLGLNGHIPKSFSIEPLLSSLLDRDAHALESKPYWESLREKIQPTGFPNLHGTFGTPKVTRISELEPFGPTDCVLDRCSAAGITLQVAGQAAWAQLLAAYTGENNVTFGTVISTRPEQGGMEDIVFPCVNTVPVFVDTSNSQQEILEHLSNHNAQIIRNSNVPLSSIQRWTNIQQAMFDTVFVYQKVSYNAANLSMFKIRNDIALTEYSLSIELLPLPDGILGLQLTYDSGLIPGQQSSLILRQYKAILRQILGPSDPEVPNTLLSDSSLMSILPAVYEHINAPARNLTQLLETSSRENGSRIAFEFHSATGNDPSLKSKWTFQQLMLHGNKFANLLLENGAKIGDLVGICFDKCPQAYFSMLGILKAGCAFVALDPGAPTARKEFILKDAACKVLFTTLDKKREFDHVEGVKVLAVDDDTILSHVQDSSPILSRNILPSDICYCLYTSGTTGTPKGCLISHDNVVQVMMAWRKLYGGHYSKESRWLQFASFHFDVNILEQYFTWSVGMCMVSIPRDVLLEDLSGNINKLGITHIDLTPSLARLVTPQEAPSLCDGIFVTGGEQLKREVIETWAEHEVIYNAYGPSEVTIGCTMHPRVKKLTKPSNIGSLYPNAGAYIMKPGSQDPVLRGGVGELCVTGPLVGVGYLNRPDLTKEKFQVLKANGIRTYRTGDLVRLLHDDTFEFLGRMDDQVKLRGQRLEIGEINEVIRQSMSQVQDVVTLVLKHSLQPKDLLVTFFTSKEAGTSGSPRPMLQNDSMKLVSSIRMTMIDKLPSYMLPTHIVPITHIPLSSNNKVENKILRRLFEDMRGNELHRTTHGGIVSEDQDPKIIAIIKRSLSSVLGIEEDDLTASSSFFELGLDSISAITLARTLKKNGIQSVQSSMIMRYSSIGALATTVGSLENAQAQQSSSATAAKQSIIAFAHRYTPIVSQDLEVNQSRIELLMPATPLQSGMISSTIQSRKATYHSTFTLQLKPGVDLARLKNAWITARMRLQILRTRFVSTKDGFAQAVLRADQNMAFWTELESNSESELDAAVEDWKSSSAQTLHRELWKIHVYKNLNSTRLALSIFHGLYDGVSLDLTLKYVAQLYNDPDTKNTPPSFFEALPYGPLSQNVLSSEFWESLSLPPRKLDLETSKTQIQLVKTSTIPPSSGISATRNILKVTEPAIFHAAWLLVLYKHFGSVPTHGIVVSGRSIDFEGADAIIGPLFNTLPCHIDTSACCTWADLVIKCHDFNTAVLPYQHTPLRNIMKWKGHNTAEPLFDSIFVFQKEDTRTILDDSPWTIVNAASGGDYPLALEVDQGRDGTFSMTLVSLTTRILDEEARQLLDDLQYIVLQLVGQSDRDLPAGMRESQILQQDRARNCRQPNMHGDHDEELSTELLLVRKHVSALAEVKAENIHPDKSIFELGLDSIDAIKLSARLRESGFSIPMSQIMQTATIRGISKRGTKQQIRKTEKRLGFDENAARSFLKGQGIDTSQFEKVLPATPVQEGLVSSMVKSKFQQYFNHEILEVRPGVDLDRLARAWQAVLRNNPILRTNFIELDDPSSSNTYLQVVRQEASLDWEPIKLREESNLDELVKDVQRTSVSRGLEQPMFSIRPVFTSGQTLLLLSMAHAVYDGTSLSMLHHDVSRSYRGEAESRPFYDFFVAESIHQPDDAVHFWRDQLQGMKPTKFLTSPQYISNQAVCFVEHISSIDQGAVSLYCQEQGITLQTLGLTSWLFVLAQRTRQLDVCSGLVLSGRSSEESEQIMFPTMNTVAFRSIIHGSISEMLHYVQDTASRISEYQNFPLRKARHIAGLLESPFDSIFLLQRSNIHLSDSQPLYHSRAGTSSTEYPVNVEWEAINGGLIFRATCSEALFNRAESSQLLVDMDKVLMFLLKNKNGPAIFIEHGEVSLCNLPKFSVNQQDHNEPDQQAEFSAQSPPSLLLLEFEEALREVLTQVSGVQKDAIKAETSIFEIGLDSISAIKISSLLRKRSIRLSVSDMMRCITFSKMARAATKASVSVDQTYSVSDFASKAIDSSQVAKRLGLTVFSPHHMPSDIEDILPATPGQEYMLQVWKSSTGDVRDTTEMFYPSFYFETSTEIPTASLQEAWSELVRQLPILRTIFLPGILRDTAESKLDSTFHQIVLSKSSQQGPIRWIDDLAAQEHDDKGLRPPLTLSAAQSNGKTVLQFQIHHALYDAVSLPLIISGLQQLGRSRKAIFDINTDFTGFLGPSMNQKTMQKRKEFWQAYFQGFVSPSKKNKTGSITQNSRTEVLRQGLLPSIDRLDKKSRSAKVSIQSLVFAIYANAYARHLQRTFQSGKDNELEEVAVGIYIANRSHDIPKLSSLAAPTLNILPLRVAVSIHPARGESFSEAVIEIAQRIQRNLGEITKIENCGASLADIFEWTDGRVRIGTTVNFLRLPEQESNDDDQSRGSQQYKGEKETEDFTIREIDRKAFEEAVGKKISPVNVPPPVPDSELRDWPDSNIYVVSLPHQTPSSPLNALPSPAVLFLTTCSLYKAIIN